MPIVTPQEREILEQEYVALESLIRNRQKNEENQLSRFAKEGIEPTTLNFPNGNEWTLLQIAIKLGDIDKINSILTESEGMALSPRDANSLTPMTLAFMYGTPQVIARIMNHPKVKDGLSLPKLISTINPSFIDNDVMRKLYTAYICLILKSALVDLDSKITLGDSSRSVQKFPF